jgi:hypothetical protein
MRKLPVLLGLLLLLGALAMLGYRWLGEPARHGRFQNAPTAARDYSPAPGDRGSRSWRGGGGRGTSGFQIFEIVIDILNVVVGVVGIWLAVVGMRMQRAGAAAQRLRADPER